MSKNADNPDSRRLLFAKTAQEDLVHLKTVGFQRCHWLALRANLERLAGCPCPGDEPNVEKLRMCGKLGGDWYRYKHDHLPTPPGIRVVFQVDDDEVTVWAVLRRSDNTYDIVEKRLKKWLAGVLG